MSYSALTNLEDSQKKQQEDQKQKETSNKVQSYLNKILIKKPYFIIIFLILITLVTNFWGQVLFTYLNNRFVHGQKRVEITLIAAIVVTGILFFFIKYFHIPLTRLESEG